MQLPDCPLAVETAAVSMLSECTDTSTIRCHSGAVHLHLSCGAVPFMLDGRPVVFSERSQELLEVNEAGAALIVRLGDPVPLDDFCQELRTSLPSQPHEAERLIIDWSKKGIIGASIDWDHTYFSNGSAAYLTLGDVCVEIRFGGDSIGRSLATAFGHLPREGSADLRAAAVPSGKLALVQVEGRPATIVPISEAGSQLRACLVELLLDSNRCVAFHAACLVDKREAILLTGGPGSGKSILAATMSTNRWACAADDIVLFDPIRGAVKGVPFPLTIKEGAWGLLSEDWPEILDYAPERRKDARWVRYLPLQSISTVEWVPVRAFVDLRREIGKRPSLHPLSKIDCLMRLCDEAHTKRGRCTPQILCAMIALVDRAEALRLYYDEARGAACLLEEYFGL